MIFNNQGVIIPDCSFYQDDDGTPNKIDFHKMKEAGAVGVILRAGQNTWPDEDFKDYWLEAKKAGLPRGSYYFYDSRAEPGRQADLWRTQIGSDLPELGLWADLEESYNGTWKGERNWKTFLEGTKLKFPGTLLGIYTANWWWQAQIIADPVYFGRYPLWIAQYVSHHLYVVLPKPWVNQESKFWQYTAKGDGPKYGVESLNIDLNYWNGDLKSFRDYFHLAETPPPPQPQPEDPMRYTATALSDGTRLRSSHDTTLTPVGSYPRGTEFHGELIWEPSVDVWQSVNGIRTRTNMAGDKWLSVSEIGGLTRVGWVAIKHMGVEICSLRDNAPPAEVTPTEVTVRLSDGSLWRAGTFTKVG